jgi:hypothetical protein
MPKIGPSEDTTLTEKLVQIVTENSSRLQMVKYFGLSKSLEIAALILGPTANPNEKANVILTPYGKLAEAIDQWLRESQGKLSEEGKRLSEKLRSTKK